MTDPQLPLPGLIEPTYTPEMTLSERFDLWVSNNEHVVTLAADLTRRWLAAGHKRAAIDMVFNQLRWESGIRTTDATGWKLNNDYRSGLSRLLMDRYDDLAGCFATRATPALDRSAA